MAKENPSEAIVEPGDRISSRGLASLIVDALVVARLLEDDDAERAIAIATEEIDVRKAMDDY